MNKTTLELRNGDRVAYRGLIREVSGIRPDASWNFGEGRQPYEVLLKPVPALDIPWSRTSVQVDRQWKTFLAFEPGDFAPFNPPVPVDERADDQAERVHAYMIGERP